MDQNPGPPVRIQTDSLPGPCDTGILSCFMLSIAAHGIGTKGRCQMADGKEPPSGNKVSEGEIIGAVKKFTRDYPTNKDFTIREATTVGRAVIYTVSFTGENGFGYRHYVLKQGPREIPRVFPRLEELFDNLQGITLPWWKDPDVIKIYMLVVIAVFLLSAIFLMIRQETPNPGLPAINPALPAIMTIIGSIVGYLIGEGKSKRL